MMKLENFVIEGKARIGVVKGDKKFDLGKSGVHGLDIRTIDDLLSNGKLGSLRSSEDRLYSGQYLPLNSVRLTGPILSPQKIYCAAINYLAHSKE